jgi:hypothetical protein
MRGVDFDKASAILVPYCLSLMQNVPEGELKELMSDIKALPVARWITPSRAASWACT